jgi:hypothetical protein
MANADVAVLAKKVFELSHLTPAQLDANKLQYFIFITAILGSATPEGIQKTNADKEARWGEAIKKEGFVSGLYPKWWLRTDDGKPPAIKAALESAIDNPNRDLRARLATLLNLPPEERAPLADLARALVRNAFDGATSDAKVQFSQRMGEISKTWTSDPWLCVLMGPNNESPPVLILIDNQGPPANDGGIWDTDRSDDGIWITAVREWDERKFIDNPIVQGISNTAWAIAMAPAAVGKVIEGAGNVAQGAGNAAGKAGDIVDALNSVVKNLPYIVGGVAVTAVAVGVIMVVTRKEPSVQSQPEPQPG